MKISEVLREAKKIFIKSEYEFVCSAVDITSASDEDKYETKRYIRSLIHPYVTVAQWLVHDNGVDLTFEKYYCYSSLRKYRSRWIDHMIEQLEKEGK